MNGAPAKRLRRNTMSNEPTPQICDQLDLVLLCRLFSECCATALALSSISTSEGEALRLRIGKSLTRSLMGGERDPETLKQIALKAAFLPTPAPASDTVRGHRPDNIADRNA